MANVNPTEALSLGIYHFHPRWTHNYGDTLEDRLREFDDVVKAGYFNSITVEVEYLNNDSFWKTILENDCTVWLSVWESFDSSKQTFNEWNETYAPALEILRANEERWERFCGFHFDEPVWRGQSNSDFLEQTKNFRELYNKRIFPVFATGEFFDSEGNAMQIKMDAKNMRKVKPEALKYVTDVAFDSYSVDVRDGYGNGSYINEMHEKLEGIVDGKTYYSELAKYLEAMFDHEVNYWFFPTCYTTGLWRGGRVGEGFCQGHLNYMAELVKTFKHPGGLVLYTYYQFSNPSELGLQSHIVLKDENGAQKIRPEQEKWWDYSADLRRITQEFKETKVDLIK